MVTWMNQNAFQRGHLRKQPFLHGEYAHFFNETKLKMVLKALQQEQFVLKQADLFQFAQTQDFLGSQYKALQDFRTFLCSENFISFLERITSLTLKRGVIDMSGTHYQDTDYLLPHDDQLEGRKLAYFVYLSDLEADDGGKLQLLDQKGRVKAEILPKFNTFAFFEVSAKSYHQVEELVVPKQRLAITGWFHA